MDPVLFFLICLTVAALIVGFLLSASSNDPAFGFFAVVLVVLQVWFCGGIVFVAIHFISKYW